MARKRIAPNAFPFPMPTVVVSAIVEGRVNHLAVGWITRTNLNPPMLAFALNRAHHTNHGIREQRAFGISVPSLEQARPTDYVGLVSGAQTDKSDVFEVFYGDLPNAPLVAEFPVAMACLLTQVVDLPTHELFIGEIKEVYCDEHLLEGNHPAPEKIRPLLLTMPDCRYWSLGASPGKAWSIGKGFRTAQR